MKDARPRARGAGQLFVVSAPSGAGKTTILKRVLERDPRLRYSVSCTTRPPRPGEVNGVDYHFLSRPDFIEGVRAGRFLEWAEVHGHLYGTDGWWVNSRLEAGFDVLLDIDVQGARQVRCCEPQVQLIFILPPSWDELWRRLQGRGTETAEQVARRLEAARNEVMEAPCYDYIVINDRLDDAIIDVSSILRSQRLSRQRQAPKLLSLFPSAAPPTLDGSK